MTTKLNENASEKFRLLTFSQTVDIISQKQNTLILCHARPDCDTLGSAFALRSLLCEMGARAWCLCANEVPHRLRFVLSGQESVLYENMPADFEAERVISVDTASPSQLGKLFEIFQGKISLMIDHHGIGEQYADGYIKPDAAATGELIFSISRELISRGVIDRIPPEADACIYAAVSSDTGGFRYSSVTPETHRIASELVASGVNSAEINRKLYEGKPLIQLKAEKLGFDRLELYREGTISVLTFPYELKKQYGIEDEYLETLIDVARTVEGVEIAAALRQPEDKNVFRCSMRSNGDSDVSRICAKFGGGGHAKAAGCTICASSIDEAKEQVRCAAEEELGALLN